MKKAARSSQKRVASTRSTAKKSTVVHSSQQTSSRSSSMMLPIALLLGSILLLTGAMYFRGWRAYSDIKGGWQVSQPQMVSGKIHFTALRPEEGDKGELALYVREFGSDDWMKIVSSLDLRQDVDWSWDGGYPGQHYEVKAVLVIDGDEVATSKAVDFVAPARNIQVPLEVNWKDLPEDAVKPGQKTSLGGRVTINGIIPRNGQLEIYAVDPKFWDETFVPITKSLLDQSRRIYSSADLQTEMEWKWNDAVPREEYMIIAVVRATGEIHLADRWHLADAGEAKLNFVFNIPASEAQAQLQRLGASRNLSILAQASTVTGISGTATIQGPEQAGTSMLLLQKTPSQQNYTVISRYQSPTQSGLPWSWAQATAGQTYQIQAALQVNNNNTSTLPAPITVTAPAQNVNFTLNTWYVMPATSATPVNNLCQSESAQYSYAQLVFPTIQNATQYLVQVGSNPSQSDLYNQILPQQNDSQSSFQIQVLVPKGKQAYVQYSYATCDNCSNVNNFAPFSQTVGFTCN